MFCMGCAEGEVMSDEQRSVHVCPRADSRLVYPWDTVQMWCDRCGLAVTASVRCVRERARLYPGVVFVPMCADCALAIAALERCDVVDASTCLQELIDHGLATRKPGTEGEN